MKTPEPMGCADCGINRRIHGRQYTKAAGWHSWQKPSQQQIKDRMQDRHAGRTSL